MNVTNRSLTAIPLINTTGSMATAASLTRRHACGFEHFVFTGLVLLHIQNAFTQMSKRVYKTDKRSTLPTYRPFGVGNKGSPHCLVHIFTRSYLSQLP